MENKDIEKNNKKTLAEAKGKVKKKKEKAKKTVGQEILSWILTIVAAVAIALVIRSFLFEPVKVDGSSMRDTLCDREIMLVTKPEYIFGNPQVGDVVICNYPGRADSVKIFGLELKQIKLFQKDADTGAFQLIDMSEPLMANTKFVKRVMGIPGDTIKIVDHKVYRKPAGEDMFVLVDEPYLTPERNDDARTAEMGEVVLGDNEYFVMGDNRDNSNDSRYVGPITRDMILGHVQFVVFPFNSIRGVH